MNSEYIPDKGDIVWIDLEPHIGHEQAGLRPALVLSPKKYNQKVRLAIFCPITTQKKNYTFEVSIPDVLKVNGVILSDQVKSLAWQKRRTKFICKVPNEIVKDVIDKLISVIEYPS